MNVGTSRILLIEPFGGAHTWLTMFEEMPTPEEHHVSFNEWLVPARNNIQRQLLRLQRLVGQPTKQGEEMRKFSPRSDVPFIYDLMVAVAFSLWRAVFQAGHATDRHNHTERARIFVNEIIRNNAAVYSTELNAWSLSYYLGNARFRLLELHQCLASNAELDKVMSSFGDSTRTHILDAPGDWIRCFHALRLMMEIEDPSPIDSRPHSDRPSSGNDSPS